MPSSKVSTLKRDDITVTAKIFRWTRRMPKWTVVVEGRELPARPLVLEAAGALPNDPTNSHQAIAILRNHGFPVYYQGKPVPGENETRAPAPVTDEFIHSLRGCLKGEGPSMLEMREREHRIEKDRLAR